MREYIVKFPSNKIDDVVLLERIVRCGYCINPSFDEFGGGWCDKICHEVKPWNYCAWGERKVD